MAITFRAAGTVVTATGASSITLTAPAGVVATDIVLAQLAVAAPFAQLDAVLDVAAIAGLDLVAELSEDGGANWRIIASSDGIGIGVSARLDRQGTTGGIHAGWDPPLPAGLVRLRAVANAVAFACAGGSLAMASAAVT